MYPTFSVLLPLFLVSTKILKGNIWLIISQMLPYICQLAANFVTVNRRAHSHQNKSMFLENNYQLLFLPPELVFNFTRVSEKMQHEVAGWTRSSPSGRQFARGTAGGLKQGSYLFVCTYRSHLLLFLSSLSFPFSHCLLPFVHPAITGITHGY